MVTPTFCQFAYRYRYGEHLTTSLVIGLGTTLETLDLLPQELPQCLPVPLPVRCPTLRGVQRPLVDRQARLPGVFVVPSADCARAGPVPADSNSSVRCQAVPRLGSASGHAAVAVA